MQLSTSQKILLSLFFLAVALVGFMVKLPAVFHNYDKQLHAAFYFFAAALLNILFAKKNFLIHFLIFAVLSCMGIVIEYTQQYSNRFFANRIHGRFDPEDVKWNVIGLIAFSVVWVLIISMRYFLKAVVIAPMEDELIISKEQNEEKYCPHCGEKL